MVVLGSDPCDLHRGEKGWRVRRLFSHREGSQRRTGGVQHATTRALRDLEKSAYWRGEEEGEEQETASNPIFIITQLKLVKAYTFVGKN